MLLRLLLLTLLLEWSLQCPRWYNKKRTCAHTRFEIISYCDVTTNKCQESFNQAANNFHKLGVKSFVRHAKSGDEGTWWPSATVPEGGWYPIVRHTHRNFPKEFIDQAHNNSQDIILYYWPQSSKWHAEHHPDWISVMANGTQYPGVAGRDKSGILCVNSPWKHVYAAQLVELVEMGADGFYFDHQTNPSTGCWCEYCKAKFKNQTGEDPPKDMDYTDPQYRKYLRFNTESINEFWKYVTQQVYQANTQVVTLVSDKEVPCTNDDDLYYMTTEVLNVSYSTAAKTEFTLADRAHCVSEFGDPNLLNREYDHDIFEAFGWVVSRDAADNRMPHIWAPHIPDSNHSLAICFALLTYGNIANPDHKEKLIPNFLKYNETYKQADLLDPWLDQTVPIRWAAVYHSENRRNELMFASPHPPNDRVAWMNLLFQTVGGFSTLVRKQAPTGLVFDYQLRKANEADPSTCSQSIGERSTLLNLGFRVIILPVPISNHFPPYAQTALHCFEQSGGILITMNQTHKWDRKLDRPMYQDSLWKRLTEASTAPYYTKVGSGEAAKLHTVGLMKQDGSKNMTFMISNDWSWVYASGHRHSTDPPPNPVHDVTLGGKIPQGCSAVTAWDILEGEKADVKVADGEFTVTFPVIYQRKAVGIGCI